MERPAWAPPGIDISVPSVSRMCDFYLGGSHNFEADRAAARRVLEVAPGLPGQMQANRAFVRRAVRYAIGAGVNQFLDVGSGIPAFGSVHETALRADAGARVLYADHDPVVVAHSRDVLAGEERAGVVHADLRRPRQILDHPGFAGLLDPERPVALILSLVLDFVEDRDDPYAAVAALRDALGPGSLLVLSHTAGGGAPHAAARAAEVYRAIRNPLTPRPAERIARFFEGYEMVAPGLTPPSCWRPQEPAEPAGAAEAAGLEGSDVVAGLAGVGRAA